MSPKNQAPPEASAPAAQTPVKEGFFQRLFETLSGGADPQREKKRLLHEIALGLKRLKTKRYDFKRNLAEPGLAKLFYEFYKTLGPAQSLLGHADSSKLMKAILVQRALGEKQQELKARLTEEAIRQRTGQGDPQAILAEVREEVKSFNAFFDTGKTRQINESYRHLSTLLELIKFDYYFMLKKFDSSLQEGAFTIAPPFEPINAQYISDELKDFLEILTAFEPTADWDPLLEALKTYRGMEVISKESFKRLLLLTRQLKRAHELEMTLQLMEKNPFYKTRVRVSRERIVEEYLAKLKMQIDMILEKIIQERRKSGIEVLAGQVFGTAPVSRLVNYTDEANHKFSKKMLGGYTHTAALNYLEAFLLDFISKDVRAAVDLLIVKGKWTDNTISQALADAFQQLLKLSEELLEFDEALAEEGKFGKKIKEAMLKAEVDKNGLVALRLMIKQMNDRARSLAVSCGQQCIALGKVLKQLLEDYRKQFPDLVMNWKELENRSDKRIGKTLVSIYKKLYHFLQMLKLVL